MMPNLQRLPNCISISYTCEFEFNLIRRYAFTHSVKVYESLTSVHFIRGAIDTVTKCFLEFSYPFVTSLRCGSQ